MTTMGKHSAIARPALEKRRGGRVADQLRLLPPAHPECLDCWPQSLAGVPVQQHKES